MKKIILSAALVISSATANATLEPRLNGNAYYDTDLNITWLADANAGRGSIFDDGLSDTDGSMTWASAESWAETTHFYGVSGWRLPTALNVDGSGICTTWYCPDTELGHLFSTFGGSSGSTINPADPEFKLFSNISYLYWTDTESTDTPDFAWMHNLYNGYIYETHKANGLYAWAVHDGDVPMVPEPATYAMLLAGLGFMGRKRAKNKFF
mgnify:CR=1 FL=1